MKKINFKIIGTILCSLMTITSFSQNWRQGGNGAIPAAWNVAIPANQLLGTTTAFPLRIITSNAEQMRITPLGFVGIGTTTPPFHLSLNNDGGILAQGTFGLGVTVPAGLTDSRLIWYPAKAAFRAGRTTGTAWDDVSIGIYSGSIGQDNIASAAGSMAFGSGVTATGQWACAFGSSTIASGAGSFAIGRQNAIASGNGSFAGGFDVSATSVGDFVFGENAFATGGFSTCFGAAAQANGQLSYAFGSYIRANATNSYVFGDGLFSNPLINSIPNSLMVGFQSDVSTFYVGVAGGTVGSLGNVGIGTSTPANRCEIDNGIFNPNTSGLRFTRLTANSPTGPNFGNMGVLALDLSGNVIYVAAPVASTITGADNGTSLNLAGTTVQFGNDVGFTTAQLLNDREIPMNNRNIFFTDPAVPTLGTNRIQTGLNTGLTYNTFSKFSSFNGEASGVPFRIGGYFTSTSTFNLTGIPLQYSPVYFGVSGANYKFGAISLAQDNTGSNGRFIGVSGGAYSTASLKNVGTSGKAYGSSIENIGINGLAAGAGANASNYGVYGVANGTGRNYGVYGSASGGAINRAGYFAGNLEYTGALISSDQMFKTDVGPIIDASSILKRIKPQTYKMDIVNYPQFNFDDVLQYGFIAQQVEQVLPALVHQSENPEVLDSLGNIIHPLVVYKSVNYNAFIPIAVQAINELGAKLDKSTLSDQTVKTNVQNLNGSLAKVKLMRGITYEWSSSAQTNMNLDSLQHIGFIAQEISSIDPLLTFVDDSSLMHVKYDRLVPVLVESIKELDEIVQTKDSIINVLKTNDSIQDYRLLALENAVNECCNNRAMQTTNGSSSIDVELKDGQSVVLEAAIPNPFAEQTTINYFLPDNILKAQMLFYNAQGKLVQSVELTEKGKGSLNVFAQDLSNGIYTYTLVVDGKVFETKKMVKQK